jgi:hypothetical protein
VALPPAGVLAGVLAGGLTLVVGALVVTLVVRALVGALVVGLVVGLVAGLVAGLAGALGVVARVVSLDVVGVVVAGLDRLVRHDAGRTECRRGPVRAVLAGLCDGRADAGERRRRHEGTGHGGDPHHPGARTPLPGHSTSH